jgi:hypothetical protein
MKTDQKYRSGKQEFPVLRAANGFPYRNENAQLLNYQLSTFALTKGLLFDHEESDEWQVSAGIDYFFFE